MSVSTTFSHYFLSPHSQNRRLLLPSSLSPPSSTPLSFSISTSQKAAVFAASFTNCSSPVENEEEDGPASIDLVPITGEEQFDRFIADAQQLDVPLILLWMANWCRKCIYLKPKLEKLAAEYYPGIRFYCVDVNNVPQRLVTRAGITKMPTIQLWRDSQKQAEVIGGQNKAWLVVDDVRRMIESEE